MATNDEILFGRIAVLSKFVTQEQVDECITIQEQMRHENADEVPHLGTIMVTKGYLSEREKRAILQVQKENLQRKDAGANARRQERIFGYLVMKLGYCTEQQVFECVREQAKLMRLNLIFRLGEVFVSKKYLTHDQVQEVLALQDKFIVTCPGCSTKFNVVRYQAGTRVKCPECGTVIQVPDVLGDAKREKDERDSAAAAASASASESTSEAATAAGTATPEESPESAPAAPTTSTSSEPVTETTTETTETTTETTDTVPTPPTAGDMADDMADEKPAAATADTAVSAASSTGEMPVPASSSADQASAHTMPERQGDVVAESDTTGLPAHEGEVAAPMDAGPADHGTNGADPPHTADDLNSAPASHDARDTA